MLFFPLRTLFRWWFKLYCGWTVVGRDNMPRSGPVLLAPNHISDLDPPCAGCSIARPSWYMAKQELWEAPFVKWVMPHIHAYPVRRGRADRGALRKSLQMLEEGKVVGIFPEGHRSPDGRLQPPELGIGLLALRSGAPVVPMAIIGTNGIFPKGSRLPCRSHVTVRIGPPMYFEDLQGRRENRETLQAVADRVMAAIASLQAQGPAQ